MTRAQRARRWLAEHRRDATTVAVLIAIIAVGTTATMLRPNGSANLSIDHLATDALPSVLPTDSPTPVARASSPGADTIPESASPTPTPPPSRTQTVPPIPQPSPSPQQPETDERHNPQGFTLNGTLTVDRYHLYEGETITVEVRVCNSDADHPVVYMIEYVDTLGLHVQGRGGTIASVGGDPNDTPRRYEEVPPGECLSLTLVWDGNDPSYGTRAKAGIFEVHGGFVGRDPDAGPRDVAHISIDPLYIEVHDGSRPAGEEPPPPTGFPDPEWSLHVRTDAEEYRVGDDVAITVEWCNETDVDQEFGDSSNAEYEFDVMVFLRLDDGSLEDVAWLEQTISKNGTIEYQPLAPGQCDGDTVHWHGRRGGFEGDGTSSGEAVPPGRYVIKAFKSPGPSDAYTINRDAETTTGLIAA